MIFISHNQIFLKQKTPLDEGVINFEIRLCLVLTHLIGKIQ